MSRLLGGACHGHPRDRATHRDRRPHRRPRRPLALFRHPLRGLHPEGLEPQSRQALDLRRPAVPPLLSRPRVYPRHGPRTGRAALCPLAHALRSRCQRLERTDVCATRCRSDRLHLTRPDACQPRPDPTNPGGSDRRRSGHAGLEPLLRLDLHAGRYRQSHRAHLQPLSGGPHPAQTVRTGSAGHGYSRRPRVLPRIDGTISRPGASRECSVHRCHGVHRFGRRRLDDRRRRWRVPRHRGPRRTPRPRHDAEPRNVRRHIRPHPQPDAVDADRQDQDQGNPRPRHLR